MRQSHIRERVAEIRPGLATAYCLDAGVLLGKLEAIYQRAICEHSFHAAARAVEIQARIAGLTPSRGVKTNDDILAVGSEMKPTESTASAATGGGK